MTTTVQEKTYRPTPYIVRLGSTYHIIVDGEPHIESQSCLDAIQSLMAAYYVFNIQYSEHVLPTLLFFQHVLLGQPDEKSKANRNLLIFLNLLNSTS